MIFPCRGLAIAMLLVLVALPVSAQGVTLRGTVAGTGDSPRPVPVAGAAIEIVETKQQALSDSLGAFSIPDLPRGEYTVKASAPGYTTITLQTSLSADQMIYISLISSRAKQFTVSGTIFEKGSKVAQRVLAGANITLMPGSFSTTSDSMGRFSIKGVPAGGYSVAVTSSDHKPTTARFNLSANQVLNISLVIDETPKGVTHTFMGTVVRLVGPVRVPVEGAVVMVSPSGYAARSDSTGRFSIPGLPPDSYAVTVRADGQRTLEQRVRVPDEGDVVLFLLNE